MTIHDYGMYIKVFSLIQALIIPEAKLYTYLRHA